MTLKELLDLLKNATTTEEIDERRNEIAALIPFVKNMFEFNQENEFHALDLWQHTLRTILGLEPDNNSLEFDNNILYFAALLHDIGKIHTKFTDLDKRPGVNYKYYEHQNVGVRLIKYEILPLLNQKEIEELFDDSSLKVALFLIGHHEDKIEYTPEYLVDSLKIMSPTTFLNLMRLQKADSAAQLQRPQVIQRRALAETWLNTFDAMFNSIDKDSHHYVCGHLTSFDRAVEL